MKEQIIKLFKRNYESAGLKIPVELINMIEANASFDDLHKYLDSIGTLKFGDNSEFSVANKCKIDLKTIKKYVSNSIENYYNTVSTTITKHLSKKDKINIYKTILNCIEDKKTDVIKLPYANYSMIEINHMLSHAYYYYVGITETDEVRLSKIFPELKEILGLPHNSLFKEKIINTLKDAIVKITHSEITTDEKLVAIKEVKNILSNNLSGHINDKNLLFLFEKALGYDITSLKRIHERLHVKNNMIIHIDSYIDNLEIVEHILSSNLNYKIGAIEFNLVDIVYKEINSDNVKDAINLIEKIILKHHPDFILELIIYHLTNNSNMFCQHLDTIADYLINNNDITPNQTTFGNDLKEA